MNNQESYLFLPESFLKIDVKITKTDGTALDTNITLENNPIPRVFDQMSLEVGSQQLEIIDHPGEMDTLLRLVTQSKTFKEAEGEIQGWIPDTNKAAIVADGNLDKQDSLTVNYGFLR